MGVPNKPGTEFRTPVVTKQLDPVWNHEAKLSNISAADFLTFAIYDADDMKPGKKDDFLGNVSLESSKFLPTGFEGELTLLNAGKKTPALKVKVVVAGAEATGENG